MTPSCRPPTKMRSPDIPNAISPICSVVLTLLNVLASTLRGVCRGSMTAIFFVISLYRVPLVASPRLLRFLNAPKPHHAIHCAHHDHIPHQPKAHQRPRQSARPPKRHRHGIDQHLVGERIEVRAQYGGHALVVPRKVSVQPVGEAREEEAGAGERALVADEEVGKVRRGQDAREGQQVGGRPQLQQDGAEGGRVEG